VITDHRHVLPRVRDAIPGNCAEEEEEEEEESISPRVFPRAYYISPPQRSLGHITATPGNCAAGCVYRQRGF